jgi:peptidoglycan/LPS O-acetylase OafA/YrhL
MDARVRSLFLRHLRRLDFPGKKVPLALAGLGRGNSVVFVIGGARALLIILLQRLQPQFSNGDRRGATPAPLSDTLCLAPSGAMLGGVALTLIDYPLVSRLIFGLSAALVIVGIVEVERSGKLAIPSGLQILGAASYSIYLVHPVALSFSLLTCWRFMKPLSAEIISVPLIVGGVAAGILYHKVVEVQAMTFARRSIKT